MFKDKHETELTKGENYEGFFWYFILAFMIFHTNSVLSKLLNLFWIYDDYLKY